MGFLLRQDRPTTLHGKGRFMTGAALEAQAMWTVREDRRLIRLARIAVSISKSGGLATGRKFDRGRSVADS